MCGIIVCNTSNKNLFTAESSISHRGKDNHSRIERDGITFSHFLHSVVGHNIVQPFSGKGILAANCEIYNWKQLAEEHGIQARNDAELLFCLLENSDNSEKSILKIIDSLDGDFACVYYREGQLVLFRDPLGVNPLFFSFNPLFIASERKANPGILRELHPRTVIFYDVTNGTARSHYKDIFVLSGRQTSYEEMRDYLFDAIDKRIAEAKQGVLFSGGVDSALIALRLAEKGVKITLYTAYCNKNSEDATYSKEFARTFGFDHVETEISEKSILQEIPQICKVIDSSDSVKVGVAIPIFFAARQASADKVKVLFSGIGADDIFAGYARFRPLHYESLAKDRLTEAMHNEQVSSLRSIYERDLYRDNCITMYNNIELRVPFLDKQVVTNSLSLSVHQLTNKAILRRILREYYNVSEKFWSRPKKAAQYGTKSMALLRRLAAKEGMSIGQFLSKHHKKNIPLAALYSGGKDSAYALYLMSQRNYDIKCLVTLKSRNKDSYLYHTPEIDNVRTHAARMGLPLIMQETAGEKERELYDLETALLDAIKKYNIEGVVTGAISSEYQRTRIESVCDRLGLRVFSPLWHVDQEMHMRRLIKDGFRFIITSVAAEGLDKSWLNREITLKDIDILVKLSKRYGINIAGEGGEFESLVIDSPLFARGGADEKTHT
ncbi:MAG: diphthine--ammonia ligase [Candidatus Micrarchaeia archaeon]